MRSPFRSDSAHTAARPVARPLPPLTSNDHPGSRPGIGCASVGAVDHRPVGGDAGRVDLPPADGYRTDHRRDPAPPSATPPQATAAPVGDSGGGEPVARRPAGAFAPHAHAAPPLQRAPGPVGSAGDLRVVPDDPTVTRVAPVTGSPGPSPAEPAANPAPAADDPADGPWALVRSAQAGDMGAFSQLFDRYYDVVFRYVLFRMNDRTLAEDITQETFLRALRRITSVTYQGRDIGAWFVTIARNLIFDHVKSSRYRLESTTSDIIELSPSTHGPEQQVLDLATNEELLRCVRKLNADQQECISLRFLQGLSVAETAKIMDRNEGAVKALQHRAVRRLAQLLPEGLR